MNLNTTGASTGMKDVTITNPDGQLRTGIGILTVTGGSPSLASAVSRKNHGGTDHDIVLPLTGTRGVECRGSGGMNSYTLVFTFSNNLVSLAGASVSAHNPVSGVGSVSGTALGPNANQCTVNLTGVSTGQYLTVTLNSVVDAAGNSGNVGGPEMGVLVGDVNANGSVNASDIGLIKSASGQSTTGANFRSDVNASGSINASDIGIAKANSGMALP